MSYNTPAQTAKAAVESGVAKANLPIGSMAVGGFLAGAYIAFGGLLAIVGSAGLDPKTWGGLTTLVTGLVFSLGLILVVIGGAELLTGNMMLLPLALLERRITVTQLLVNWGVLFVANLAGSLFVAYVLAYKTGVIGDALAKAGSPAAMDHTRLVGIVTGKGITETNLQVFLRAIGCNWLVCLGVWLALAAHDVVGKIAGIIFPITAFVALGFDHVVANMFFLPLGMFVDSPGLTWADVIRNIIFAFLGNAVGAGVFVSCAYWYTYLRPRPDPVVQAPGASEAMEAKD
ncbi:formate/nitrite transporter family protein [Flexivirga meconopsidis]|uniref:formate/nitrite transporter family protein n=1 Tax=Flexivirga meconopsidis TaxID=2977121 RepID=UPI00223F2700|nr:formate/nitrite transporter family protein [Flexivirga meconopsidis]